MTIAKERERSRHHNEPTTYRSLTEWAKNEYNLIVLPTKTVMFGICTNPKVAKENRNTGEKLKALSKQKYAKHVTLESAFYN